ncbi:MAG: class I SAM-dependent methyltransferase [Candidatus Gottesmanbacteria bacterium]
MTNNILFFLTSFIPVFRKTGFSEERNKDIKDLNNRHYQVPPDYYDQGIRHNVYQKIWHGWRFIKVREILKGIKPKKILDIGCHGGTLTEIVSKNFPQAEVYAIDISLRAINYAQKKRPKIHFLVADAKELPFKDNDFDLVTCSDTFEHLPNSQKVLAEIRRVLTKDGQVLFIIPTESFLFKLVWLFWINFGPGRVWQETHIHKFNGHKLDKLLEKSGFKVKARKIINLGMLLLIRAKKIGA